MSTGENPNRGRRGGRGYSRGGGRGRGNYGGGGFYRGGYYGKPFNKRPQNYHQGEDGKRTKFEVTNRLKEVDIGVTEFVGSHEHFPGIVKERFGDFHVHEIACNGEIARLSSQDFPPDLDDHEDLESLKAKIPQDIAEKIESITKEDSEIKSVEIDVTDMGKEPRRIIHIIAKKTPSIVSQTVDKDNRKYMTLTKSKKNQSGNRFYRDTRVDWSRRPGLFCHFLLHKVNMDTMDALNQMAMLLRVKPNMFYYAGTKDRRARTTQWISLRRVDPREILEAAKRVRGAYVGNFKYAKDPLRLGLLNGNHFTIALRNVTGTDEQIEKALTSLRDNGFVNYYGLQRFGSVAAIPTQEVGKALLQGKWSEAIDLILKPRSGEQWDMTEAREIWSTTKDAAAALKRIYRHDKLEAKLLRGIIQSGKNNPQGALDMVPRNARTMYIHAYQSYVWNNMVSRRIREFGPKPIVGDLVYEKSDIKDEVDEPLDEEEDGQDKEKETPLDGAEKKEENDSSTAEPSAEDEKVKIDEDESENKKEEVKGDDVEKMETEPAPEAEDESVDKKNDTPVERDYASLPAVKILTEEDLPNYKFTDIVMPQPGWRVTYPTYAKAWYDEFLGNDGLDTDLRQKNRKYSLGGAYRKILQVPENLTWRTMRYKGLTDDLILCDIDEFRGNEAPKDEPEGQYKALIIEMSLKPSTYATMALREILTHDTSAQTQAEQSAAHHAKDAEDRRMGEEQLKKEEEVKEEKIDDAVDEATEAISSKMEVAEEGEEVKEVQMEAEPIETPNDAVETLDEKE